MLEPIGLDGVERVKPAKPGNDLANDLLRHAAGRLHLPIVSRSSLAVYHAVGLTHRVVIHLGF